MAPAGFLTPTQIRPTREQASGKKGGGGAKEEGGRGEEARRRTGKEEVRCFENGGEGVWHSLLLTHHRPLAINTDVINNSGYVIAVAAILLWLPAFNGFSLFVLLMPLQPFLVWLLLPFAVLLCVYRSFPCIDCDGLSLKINYRIISSLAKNLC